MPEQLELFKTRLPSHGYATDDLQYGLRFLPLSLAIQKAIIQYNWRHSIGWLAYDLDSETARFDWYDRSCPPPNILILNPENGHGHILYGLQAPVHNYDHASQKALRYMGAIDVALTEELGADRGYSKLLCKNPLNDRWEVLFPRLELYDLDELASWVDLEKYQDRRRRLPKVGYGRNVTLFETLRVWAYRARRRQGFLSEEMFRDAVLNHALALNAGFEPPLSHAEVRGITKSVSQWTWAHLSPEGFIERQRALGKRSGQVRRAKADELRERILEIAEQCPTLTHEDIAAVCGVHRVTVTRHMNVARTISDNRACPGPDRSL